MAGRIASRVGVARASGSQSSQASSQATGTVLQNLSGIQSTNGKTGVFSQVTLNPNSTGVVATGGSTAIASGLLPKPTKIVAASKLNAANSLAAGSTTASEFHHTSQPNKRTGSAIRKLSPANGDTFNDYQPVEGTKFNAILNKNPAVATVDPNLIQPLLGSNQPNRVRPRPVPATGGSGVDPSLLAAILASNRTPIFRPAPIDPNQITATIPTVGINRPVPIPNLGNNKALYDTYTDQAGGTKSTQANDSGDGVPDNPQYSIPLPGSGNLLNFDPLTGDYSIVDPKTGNTIIAGNMYDNNNGSKTAGKVTDPTTGNTVTIDPKTGTFTVVNKQGAPVPGGNFYANEKDKGVKGDYVITFPTSGDEVIINPKTGDYTIVDPKTGNTIGIGKNGGGTNGIKDPESGDKVTIDAKTGVFTITDPPTLISLGKGNIYAPQPGKGQDPSQNPGQNPGPNPGQNPGQTPGQNQGPADWLSALLSQLQGVQGGGGGGYANDGASADPFVVTDGGAVAAPSPVLPPNPPPQVPAAAPNVAIVNPQSNGIQLSFTVDGEATNLPVGTRIDLSVAQPRIIEFDRGGTFGPARYSLDGGLYTFTPTDHGWELYRTAYVAPASE